MNSEEEILHTKEKDVAIHASVNQPESVAILHSYTRDRMNTAKTFIGNKNTVTDEEVQILADYSARAKRRAQNRFLAVLGALFVITAGALFLIPYLFPVTVTTPNTQPTTFSRGYNGINTDVTYTAMLPKTTDEIKTLGKKTILHNESTARIILTDNGIESNFSQLVTSLLPRFEPLLATVDNTFVYGAVRNPNTKKEEKFIILKTINQDESVRVLKNIERTLFSDLRYLLNIKEANDVNGLETRLFIDNDSITLPARVLEYSDRTPAFMYGFVDNTYIVFTTSFDSFDLLKNKLLGEY